MREFPVTRQSLEGKRWLRGRGVPYDSNRKQWASGPWLEVILYNEQESEAFVEDQTLLALINS